VSKTLFWYIFWQLLKIFVMATCALSAIMCFAGMLRPITEQGLDLRQVNRMLLYMTPAMSTYSLPVAALFAATIVYGRFSADNELTAMRAGGIGYLSLRRFSIALPALVLGLVVATISLIMLCFIVPIYSFKVEQIIYSNLAQVIAGNIDRDHEANFAGLSGDLDVFADSAQLIPADPNTPLIEQVRLMGPAVATYENADPNRPGLRIPREFWLARTALITITRSSALTNEATMPVATFRVELNDGIKFPRQFTENVQAGVADTTVGPLPISSPIRENVKFMGIGQLEALAADPGKGQRVQEVLQDMIRREQRHDCLMSIATPINSGQGLYEFPTDPADDTFQIGGDGATAVVSDQVLILTAPPRGDSYRTVWFRQSHGSQQTLFVQAKEIRVHATPDPLPPSLPDGTQPPPRMSISVEMYDAQVATQTGPSERLSFIRSFSEPMGKDLLRVADKTLTDFRDDPTTTDTDRMVLNHQQVEVNNSARTELHGRASFALSCLILVMVGTALGVMFKSGNFLNAFAVSFIPALVSITLIFCGQQTATHVPYDMVKNFHDPLKTGLWFIWSGNLAVLVGAVWLTIRLERR
jgi:lipopolysaccharide export LptBFGC system permease protein LptF